MKNWILCEPGDRQTMASMRYILETCQSLKDYVHNRIYLGHRRDNRKPLDMLINGWSHDYLRIHKVAEDAPRYALKDAMKEVLVNGIAVHPRERKDYWVFTVEPRPGWRKAVEKPKEVAWGEYLEGKSAPEKEDGRIVHPVTAVDKFFEDGFLSFRWGCVSFRGDYIKKIQRQMQAQGIEDYDFLKKVKEVDFELVDKEDWMSWRVNFTLER